MGRTQSGLPVQDVPHIVGPQSDVMNTPEIVAQMQAPSTYATATVGPWQRKPNVLGDAWGLGTPYDTRFNDQMAVETYAQYMAAWQRQPNTQAGVPGAPRMSDIAQRFVDFLARVQQSLIGAP